MVKLLLWGIVAYIAYMYFRPRLAIEDKPREKVKEEDDYVTIRIPKNKKPKSDADKYTDYDEVN